MKSGIEQLLGRDFKIINRKYVMGIPDSWMPTWLSKEVADHPLANMNAFVKPQYYDVTYFHGAGLHQDIIDFEGRRSQEKITLYVYLLPVGDKQSPLFVLPRSHELGPTVFPHNVSIVDKEKKLLRYTNEQQQSEVLGISILIAVFHFLNLHNGYTL